MVVTSKKQAAGHHLRLSCRWVFLICLMTVLLIPACDDKGSNNDKIRELNAALEAERWALQETRQTQEQKQEEIDRLLLEITESEQKIQENDTTIEVLTEQQKDDENKLQSLIEENQELITEIENKLAAIESLQAELTDQTRYLADLREELELTTSKLDSQESLVALLEEQLSDLAAGDSDWSRLQQELINAQNSLAATEEDLAALRQALQQAEYLNVQIFLENLGPERLFVLDDRDLRKTYQIPEDHQCKFIFSIDQKVEFLHNDADGSVPSIQGYEALPLGITYHKVAVCGPSGENANHNAQLHYETGRIFKVIPSNNVDQRSLLTSRTESSCDQSTTAIKDRNIFSRRFQFIYPYSGSVDGIETIAILRLNNQSTEYTMGSAVVSVRSSSCEEVLSRPETSSLARTACQFIKNHPANERNAQVGCFTEGKEVADSRIGLDFYPIVTN